MILDASVIVAWFVTDEPFGQRALEVRTQTLGAPESVVVPAICWTEVAHALVRAIRRGRLPREALEPAGAALRELAGIIPTREVDPVESMRLAIEQGTGVYDATYLVLARSLRQPLLTLDRRLAAVGEAGAIDVVWLGALGRPAGDHRSAGGVPVDRATSAASSAARSAMRRSSPDSNASSS